MHASKRNFLRTAFAAPLAATLITKTSFAVAGHTTATQTAAASTAFTLPPLQYDFAALEPHIDKMTMMLHHDKHHQAFVTNLNNAAAKNPILQKSTPEQLISNLSALPQDIRTLVQNNGGGHVNHTMFWRIMKPMGGGEPTGAIADVIKTNFTSFANFKEKFNDAGAKRFGSGWVWLVRNPQGKFELTTTANQDNPLMQNMYPVMGNDVWEHAYYLKYNNRRAEYLAAWWNTVNWDEINTRLRAAK